MDSIWGINCFGHDASVCVVKGNKIVHHERLNGEFLTEESVARYMEIGRPEVVCYYEKPFLKRTRQFYSGEFGKAFSLYNPKLHLMEHGIFSPVKYISHHKSHAAASYFLSSYDDCYVVVADAIGEWETLTVWHGYKDTLTKLHSKKYPYSLGLFYSAFTKYCGLVPMRDENKFMELSGDNCDMNFYSEVKKFLYKNNHRGISKCNVPKVKLPSLVQRVFEDEIETCIQGYKGKPILFAGGCAYNKKVVSKFNLEIVVNPGDCSSSIGAVAAFLNKKLSF